VAKGAAAAPRARARLSRALVLRAALELVDLDGLEALTMRRLAEQLKVDPMSLYNHVNGKEALLDGIAEALWNEVQLPVGETNWRDSLRRFATALRGMAHTHPHAYPLLMSRGILTAPELEAIEGAIHALERAGMTREQAAEMIRTLFAYAVGYGMLELSTPAPCGATVTEQIVNLTRVLPKDAPFHLVEIARLVCDCDMDYQFDLGLDLIVSGLEARLP
jgi:AcrR family transcriptional regulator